MLGKSITNEINYYNIYPVKYILEKCYFEKKSKNALIYNYNLFYFFTWGSCSNKK